MHVIFNISLVRTRSTMIQKNYATARKITKDIMFDLFVMMMKGNAHIVEK